MYSAAEEHTLYRIANTAVREYPYPHLYVEDVFPSDFYAGLRANWPAFGMLKRLDELGRVGKGDYPDRFVMPLQRATVAGLPEEQQAFWLAFGEWLMRGRFLDALVDKFRAHVERRFNLPANQCEFDCEALIVRDRTNYAIGPHTDAPHRLLSLLFYCPDNTHRRHLGTSIYVPKDPEFRCPGGPHYPHAWFNRVTTMEYLPNTLFAFFKTDHSFHGVETISDPDVERDVLLYDIRVIKPDPQMPTARVSGTGVGMGLKMLKDLFGGKAKPRLNQGES
jgi:hypothetical protein